MSYAASGSNTSGGGGGLHLPSPLLWAAAGWAVLSEAWALLQYRRMQQRDSARRSELFPATATNSAPPCPAAPLGPPAVSIIVPALNEAAGIEQLLRYLQHNLQPAAAEIIVVDGGSSDATVALAQGCGVRVVQAGRGRARQMNAGAAAASGELLVARQLGAGNQEQQLRALPANLPPCTCHPAPAAAARNPNLAPVSTTLHLPPPPAAETLALFSTTLRLHAGDIFVFVHADARPPPQLVALVRAALRRPCAVLGGFRTLIGEGARPRFVVVYPTRVLCNCSAVPAAGWVNGRAMAGSMAEMALAVV